MAKYKVTKGKRVKEQILAAAVVVAERDGYKQMTRAAIAKQANCAEGSINHYYTTMEQLRVAVIRRAIKDRNATIIVQGIANGDRRVMRAPDEVRTEALAAAAS